MNPLFMCSQYPVLFLLCKLQKYIMDNDVKKEYFVELDDHVISTNSSIKGKLKEGEEYFCYFSTQLTMLWCWLSLVILWTCAILGLCFQFYPCFAPDSFSSYFTILLPIDITPFCFFIFYPYGLQRYCK